MASNYTLYYWRGIPGRGEFIRLAFEYTKTPYKDVTDAKQIVPFLSPKGVHFAPPILDDSGEAISQTSAILAHIAPKLGLAGTNDVEKARITQLTLTALDVCSEAHDTHHPVSPGKYFEEQEAEALSRSEDFRQNRIPKFLTHFETVLANNGTGVLVGSNVSAADLTLYQVIDGVEHAFPRRMASMRNGGKHVKVFELKDRLGKDLEDYLTSERRTPYAMGIFRHYPQLDGE